MEKFLRPSRFDCNANDASSGSQWIHWLKTFNNFVITLEPIKSEKKLQLLINFLSANNYAHISSTSTFEDAINILENIFVKPNHEIFARYLLLSRKQSSSETISQYLSALQLLTKDCSFKSVSALENLEDHVRDALIGGLASNNIRQRLLEHSTLKLKEAVNCALSLESAHRNAEHYNTTSSPIPTSLNAIKSLKMSEVEGNDKFDSSAVSSRTPQKYLNAKCYFCGGNYHSRNICPAKNATCYRCTKIGHFGKMCKSTKSQDIKLSACEYKDLATIRKLGNFAEDSKLNVQIGTRSYYSLLDSGSAASFIDKNIYLNLHLPKENDTHTIVMASKSKAMKSEGICRVNLRIGKQVYNNFPLIILNELCAPLILGRDFMAEHKHIKIKFNGERNPITIGSLQAMNIEAPQLFQKLSNNVRAIAVPVRRYSNSDSKFIEIETRRLLEQGIIEDSNSPWRAQTLVVKGPKPRLVIDYSMTINRYSEPDAYPLPLIDDLVQKIAENCVYSKVDLKSAYHQIPLREEDKKFTAFQANNNLYQFTRLPFGLTNAVAAFQRVMDGIVRCNNLEKTYVYLDDVIVGGRDEKEHDKNLKNLINVMEKLGITPNNEKCVYSKRAIKFLGYHIEGGKLSPDPERLGPLMQMTTPKDASSLKRLLGLFSYYAKWIRNYSEKLQPLLNVTQFPLTPEAMNTIELFKNEIKTASLVPFDDNSISTIETDASDHTVSAILLQNQKPISFFSRTLKQGERHLPSIEKEAMAIVEAVEYWRHFLHGRFFNIITDQKAVSFIFNKTGRGRTKNDKVLRWKIELSTFHYDVKFRPGAMNLGADALSRTCAHLSITSKLTNLHELLCHPGVTRLTHYIRSRNLAYSVEDVRNVCNACRDCRELKPKFFKPMKAHLIKATTPFERISIDFLGPKSSCTKNKYLLTMIDEYSRFPFCFPCPDMTASTVIKCLKNLFHMFGHPGAVHSDRGRNFMSEEVSEFLCNLGINQTRTTPYNPRGNGQCERYNGIIWKTILLSLRTQRLQESHWELVLPQTLHAIRSLLCTSTNTTPHERMFKFDRRGTIGSQLPTWLTQPGPVYLRKFVRENKSSPLVERVHLMHANNQYAVIKYDNGREDSVSIKDLAPCETPLIEEELKDTERFSDTQDLYEDSLKTIENAEEPEEQLESSKPESSAGFPYNLRSSSRIRKVPNRLDL